MIRGRRNSLWRSRIIQATFLILLLCGHQAMAAEDDDPTKDIHFQVMVGATEFSDLKFDQQSTTDPSVHAETEIGTMPVVGIIGQMPFNKARFNLGLEGGVLFGWRSDTVTAHGSNGTIRLHIDSDMFLFDLSLGPYVSAQLGKHMRIYAGAGPLWMFGQYDQDTEEEVNSAQTLQGNDTSTTSGGGLYARTGIEYIFNDGSMIGVCVRGFNSRLNFEDVSGDTDVKGVQILFSFSVSPDLYK